MPDLRSIRSIIDAIDAAEPLLRRLLTSPSSKTGPTTDELRALPDGTVVISDDGEVWKKREHRMPISKAPCTVWQGDRMYLTHTNLRRSYDTLEIFDPTNLTPLALSALAVGTFVRGRKGTIWENRHGGGPHVWSDGSTYRTSTEIFIMEQPISVYEPQPATFLYDRHGHRWTKVDDDTFRVGGLWQRDDGTLLTHDNLVDLHGPLSSTVLAETEAEAEGLSVQELQAFKPPTQVTDRHGVVWTKQFMLPDAWATVHSSNPSTSQNLHDVAGPISLHKSADEGLYSDSDSDELEGLPAGSVVQDANGAYWTRHEDDSWRTHTTTKNLRATYGPLTLISEPEPPSQAEGLSAEQLDSRPTGSVVIDASGQHWTGVRTLVNRKMTLTWVAPSLPGRLRTKQLIEQRGPIKEAW